MKLDVQEVEVDLQTAKRQCTMFGKVTAHNGYEAYKLDNTIGVQMIR